MDEILALEEGKIKFAKRKLRVQRCKVITPTSSRKKTEKGMPVSSSSSQKSKIATGGTITNPRSGPTPIRTPTSGSVPKGDPNFGKQLEHLSKEERKKEKAGNADRVARRLAKKRVKAAMAKESLKFGGDGMGKERVRVRKKGGGAGGPLPGKAKAKKSRVRSEANLAKRNMKK